jgi:chemotaxis signal transduction protein
MNTPGNSSTPMLVSEGGTATGVVGAAQIPGRIDVARSAAGPACGEEKFAARFWLLCRTGPHHFALPVPPVIETMRLLPIESIAGAPPFVHGMCIIRGVPVAVIDTAALFGSKSARYDRLITVRTGQRIVAFAAEAILAVEAIPAQTLGELPPLLRSDDTIAAIAARDQDLLFFLQAARVIADDFLLEGHAVRGQS